ncbi:MAG: AAA family ATPase [Bacteroidetes bacterium]|nr:AAA family ATPase [Bacteroidota bacterium]
MSGFKLIAIRPLKGCNKRFLKVLEEGEIYCFYSDYKFEKTDDGIVVKIIHTQSTPEKLYSVNDLAINISAVVGKNGSGKSALLELFFASIYLVSTNENILFPNLESLAKQLEELDVKNSQAPVGDYKKKKSKLELELKNIKKFSDQLKIEIYYAIDESIYCLRLPNTEKENLIEYSITNPNTIISSREAIFYELKKTEKVNFQKFFYSVAVNYSIHGLNSLQMGSWIEYLFHKNDGYKTPIVINPMRTKGNIDMNKEIHLAQSRLLANLVGSNMDPKIVIERKEGKRVSFAIDKKKLIEFNAISLENVLERIQKTHNTTLNDLFAKTYKQILGVELDIEDAKNKVKYFDEIVKYCIKKLFKIAAIYQEYHSYYTLPIENPPIPTILEIDNYLNELGKDKSHITLKLRQILNLVRFNLLEANVENGITWKKGEIELSISELTDRINKAKADNPDVDLIELVPVAFFKPTFYITNGEDDKSVSFDLLSSGEQQFVHSVQSILYHLINLNSIFSASDPTRKKSAYRFVNFILDEIELYFHPELQKKFISELLNGISRLAIPEIKGINILFSTHSPFILSDIPNANLLRLKEGKVYDKYQKETFGTNIHELLHNDFFLQNGFIGEKAESFIIVLIKELNGVEPNSLEETQVDEYKRKIGIVGEHFLRAKLLEMLETKARQN